MRAWVVCGLLFSAAAGAARAPASDPLQGDGRTPAFYRWTQSVPAKPGRLLRSEPLDAALGLANAASQSRFLYSSTDGVTGNTPIVVSGAFFTPRGTPPSGGWPVVAWAHGTVGMADICAPSLLGRSYRDIVYLNRWLAEGYAIVATDYQGLGVAGAHPYVNSRAEAYSVLDSIRAVQSEMPDLSRKVVIIGQSQGAQAAFAAAAFAPTYAPELDLRGTVATGTPYVRADQGAAGFVRDSNPNVDYVFYLLLLAQQRDPTLPVASVLSERALPVFEQTRAVCNTRIEFDVEGAGLTRANALKADSLVQALEPVIGSMAYPTLKIASPVFMGIGGKDEAVTPSSQLALTETACAAGTVVEAHFYAALSHSGAVSGSLPDSIPFVRKVMAGQAVAPACTPARDAANTHPGQDSH